MPRLMDLQRDLAAARSAAEWLDIAAAIDALTGAAEWREADGSEFFHEALIREHISSLQALMARQDWLALADLLQQSLYRHLGELNNPQLYQYALTGTKTVVTTYLDTVEQAMRALAVHPVPGLEVARKRALFERAERVYGRPALILSGGGAFGIYHLGVVKALWEARLLPRIIAGSSMGAIIATAVCNRSDAELAAFFAQPLAQIDRTALRWRHPRDMWVQRSAMDPAQVMQHILANTQSATFAEAHARSGRVLNITVSATRAHQKPRLLSHLTSPDVLIEYAALASCAVPGLFPPVVLQERHHGVQRDYMPTERWMDGTFDGDLPRERLARLHNVNQTIVSQANPHVIPFITHRQQRGAWAVGKHMAASVLHAVAAESMGIARQVLDGTPLRPVVAQAHALANQRYLGDVTIRFPFRPQAYLRVLSNPSLAGLAEYVALGQQATWPVLPMIADLTRVSRTFDDCLALLAAQAGGADAGLD